MSVELKTTFYYDDKFNVYLTPYEAWKSYNTCYFYYYDNLFSQFDWKTEPTETLQNLYKERAQQIRDDYEYVILCYSGGNDSSNILETFYYNNIHIDEIVIVGALSQDKTNGTDDNHNADIYFNVMPTINSMNLPNTKITVVDYTKYFRDLSQFSLIQNHGADYFKYIGIHTSPHNLFWYDFRRFVGASNTKKTAWIMGNEKVDLSYDKKNHKPFVYFNDSVINSYGMRYVDENFERVNFYNGPHECAAKIQIKQAHILHKELSMITVPNVKGKLIRSRHYKNKLFYEKQHIKLAYQSEKSKTRFLSARDMYLTQTTNSDIYSLYIDGLKNHQEFSKDGISVGTKPYYIT